MHNTVDACDAGYAHPKYAESLRAWGVPRRLVACDGWAIERAIPHGSHRDAMGCYPLFFCRHWERLAADVAALREDLVAFSIVADPFGCPGSELLRDVFDTVLHFKDHFVTEFDRPLHRIVKASHLANVRKAQRSVTVSLCQKPQERIDEWMQLYAVLARRRSITGLRLVSAEAFAMQFSLPGLVLFEAHADDVLVGLDAWYLQGDVAYGHVVAFSELGYQLRASYATKWAALSYFESRVRWVDLGGGAGLSANDDGLMAFKAGWATAKRPVFFCGKILRPMEYEALSASAGHAGSSYFPAYRHGEFQ